MSNRKIRWKSQQVRKALATIDHNRGLTMILSIAVLLGISFMLSLPAKTLTPDKAVEQGGIE